MKIRKVTLYKAAIAIILVLDLSLFYIIDLPAGIAQYNSTYTKALISAVAAILAFICYFSHQDYFANYKFVKNFCGFCLILICLLIMHGVIIYPSQGIMSLFRNCDYLLLVLLVVPILYILGDEIDFYHFMKMLNYITIFWYAILIAQSVIYSTSGNIILTYYSNSDNLWIRNDRIRFSLLSLGNIMIFYNFYILLSSMIRKQKKILYLIAFLMGVYCNLFVQQTRALEFTMVITLAVMYLIQSNNKVKVIRNYAIILIGFILLYASGILSNFFDSFTAADTAKNTLVRQEAIAYYIQYWIKHPLFGMGLTNSEALTRGPFGTYYMSDVGFVGIVAKCGIFAFVLYILLFVRWIRIILKIRKTEYKEISILLVGMFLYTFVPSYSISIFISAYSISVPIIICIFEFWNYEILWRDAYEYEG